MDWFFKNCSIFSWVASLIGLLVNIDSNFLIIGLFKSYDRFKLGLLSLLLDLELKGKIILFITTIWTISISVVVSLKLERVGITTK